MSPVNHSLSANLLNPKRQNPKPTMASSFESASRKLLEGTPRFPLIDLPTSRDDPLWEAVRDEYRLSLAELSSLKNYAHQQQQQQPAFLVGAVVRGAKQSNGARGNVFKFLERHLGHYSEQEGIQIRYEQDDLHIHAYFLSYDAACQLQTALNEWEIHKELANLRGISLDPLTPAQTARPPDLKRIYLQDYNPQESESPCQTLDQLHSYRLSVPVTEPAEPNTPLVRFQSIDKVVPHLKHYKCHLKDKAKFKHLQNDENNMLAASWTFHQQLDGLNVEEGMPLAAISVKKASSGQIAAHDNRYSVTLLIEFFYPELAAVFAAPVEAGKGDQENTWETVVYVQDRNVFAECVRWKFQDTMEQWQKHRAFLEQE